MTKDIAKSFKTRYTEYDIQLILSDYWSLLITNI